MVGQASLVGAACQLSKRMGGVHLFCNIGLVVLQKGGCVISKTEEDQGNRKGQALFTPIRREDTRGLPFIFTILSCQQTLFS